MIAVWALALAADRLYGADVTETLRTGLFDAYLKTEAPTSAQETALIAIDEASIAAFGQWPWPRALVRELAEKTAATGAKTLVFDIVFSEPDRYSPAAVSSYLGRHDRTLAASALGLPDEDKAFADALGQSAVVLSMTATSQPAAGPAAAPLASRVMIAGANVDVGLPEHPGFVRNLPRLEAAAAGIGVSGLYAEHDGVVRRLPLIFSAAGAHHPSLPLEALRIHRGEATIFLDAQTGGVPARVGVAGDVWLTDERARVWPPYAAKKIDLISALDILAGNLPADRLSGKAVVIGVTASGVAPGWTLPNGAIAAGAVLQTIALTSLLDGTTAGRPGHLVIVETGLTLVAATIFLLLVMTGRTVVAFAAALGLTAAAFAASRFGFRVESLLIDPVFPAVVLLVAAVLWGLWAVIEGRLSLLAVRQFAGGVVEMMPDGVIVTDRRGVVVFTNPAGAQIAKRLGPPEVGPDGGPPSYEHAAEGGPLGAGVLSVASSWLTEAAGEFGVHVVRDRSEVVAAESAAALAADRLHVALENLAGGLALFNQEGQIVLHSPRFADVAGGPRPRGFDGASYEEVMAGAFPELPERAPNTFSQCLSDLDAAGEVEFEGETAAGAVLVRIRPTNGGGAVAIFTDIRAIRSATREAEAAKLLAEDANRAKDRVLANVSHELRTPLNAIIGFADAMASGVFGPMPEERQQECLHDILRSGAEMLDLVEALLDVAAVDEGAPEPERLPVDLVDVVRSQVEKSRGQADRLSVAVTLEGADFTPPRLTDASAVGRALAQLLANAIRFTPAGGWVTVTVVFDAMSGHLIKIEDSGPGMSAAEIERAFEPFWKADLSIYAGSEGVGIGLPLAKALVEREGGALLLESPPGEGVSAEIRFPPAAYAAAQSEVSGPGTRASASP